MNERRTVTINRGDDKEVIEVFINGDSASTRPYNMNIEDSVKEMIDDIGEWDYKYLKELVEQDCSLYPNVGL